MDIALNENIILLDKLDLALQELDILFSTENTELLGETQFGTNWHQFLWEIIPSCSELEKYIEDKISSQCYWVNQFEHHIDVSTANYEDRAESVYVVKIQLINDTPFGSTMGKRVFILS